MYVPGRNYFRPHLPGLHFQFRQQLLRFRLQLPPQQLQLQNHQDLGRDGLEFLKLSLNNRGLTHFMVQICFNILAIFQYSLTLLTDILFIKSFFTLSGWKPPEVFKSFEK